MTSPTNSRRILVVDDETIILTFLQNLIRYGSNVFEIETASRGREAVSLAARFSPHVVVLDVNIPEIDGVEVCRAIRQLPNCRNTNVLGITASTMPERIREMQQAGARECLTKPFSLKEFLTKVERYADESLIKMGTEATAVG